MLVRIGLPETDILYLSLGPTDHGQHVETNCRHSLTYWEAPILEVMADGNEKGCDIKSLYMSQLSSSITMHVS